MGTAARFAELRPGTNGWATRSPPDVRWTAISGRPPPEGAENDDDGDDDDDDDDNDKDRYYT